MREREGNVRALLVLLLGRGYERPEQGREAGNRRDEQARNRLAV